MGSSRRVLELYPRVKLDFVSWIRSRNNFSEKTIERW